MHLFFPEGGFKNVSMPDMKREQEICMSNSSNNNACTCSYTGSFEKEYFGTSSNGEKGSPNNSYKSAVASNGKSSTMVILLLICFI